MHGKNYENKLLNIKDAAEMLGISADTLRNWDKSGKFFPIRTVGNHRRYNEEDIKKILNSTYVLNGELRKDKTVVYTYVCGDILHRGHLLYLKNAKSMGDFLIVGVLTNKAVMERKSEPFIDFEERIELIECLKMVDMAVPQDEYSPYTNMTNLRPDILFESTSHNDELLAQGKEYMESIGGKMVVAAYYPHQSSTKIKSRMLKNKQGNRI